MQRRNLLAARLEDQPRVADLLLVLPTYLAVVALEVEQRKGPSIWDICKEWIQKQMQSGRLCTIGQSQLC